MVAASFRNCPEVMSILSPLALLISINNGCRMGTDDELPNLNTRCAVWKAHALAYPHVFLTRIWRLPRPPQQGQMTAVHNGCDSSSPRNSSSVGSGSSSDGRRKWMDRRRHGRAAIQICAAAAIQICAAAMAATEVQVHSSMHDPAQQLNPEH